MLDTKKLLGARIQELRRQKNFKQAQLAEIIDVDSKHISKIECGRCFPSILLLDKIAKALGIELYELLDTSYLKSRDEIILEINKILTDSSKDKLKNIYVVIKNLV